MTPKTIRLSRIARVVNGGTPTSDSEYWEGDVPWATPVDLGANHGSSLRTTLRALTPAGVAAGSTIVPTRSVLVSTRAPIGYVAVNEVPMAFNQGVKALVPGRLTDALFLAYAIQANSANLQAAGQGSTFTELSTGALASTRVPAVELGQQRRIAEFLERETSQIDELITKQEQLISTLAERRMSLVVRSVTRGLDPHAPLRDTGARWIGSTPTHWLTPRLGHLLQVRNGADYKDVQADDGDYPVFGSGGEFARANAYLYDGEALLLGRKGTIDRPLIARGRFWTVDTMFYAVPIAEVDLQFLYFAALCFPYGELSTATALPSMTSTALKAIRVPRPPLDEQRAISAFLGDATAKIDLLRERAESAIVLLRERRQALISAAVTGQIDVGGAS